jgi:hypothetical protein
VARRRGLADRGPAVGLDAVGLDAVGSGPARQAAPLLDRRAHPREHVDDRPPGRVDADAGKGDVRVAMDGAGDEPERGSRWVAGDLLVPSRDGLAALDLRDGARATPGVTIAGD